MGDNAIVFEFRAKADQVYAELKNIRAQALAVAGAVNGRTWTGGGGQFTATTGGVAALAATSAAAQNVAQQYQKVNQQAKELGEHIKGHTAGMHAFHRALMGVEAAAGAVAIAMGAAKLGSAWLTGDTEKIQRAAEGLKHGIESIPIVGKLASELGTTINNAVTGIEDIKQAMQGLERVSKVTSGAMGDGMREITRGAREAAIETARLHGHATVAGLTGDAAERGEMRNEYTDKAMERYAKYQARIEQINSKAGAEHDKAKAEFEKMDNPSDAQVNLANVVMGKNEGLMGYLAAYGAGQAGMGQTDAKNILDRRQAYEQARQAVDNAGASAEAQRRAAAEDIYGSPAEAEKAMLDAKSQGLEQRLNRERRDRIEALGTEAHAESQGTDLAGRRRAERIRLESEMNRKVWDAERHDFERYGAGGPADAQQGETYWANMAKHAKLSKFNTETQAQLEAADKHAENQQKQAAAEIHFAETGDELQRMKDEHAQQIAEREADRSRKSIEMSEAELNAYDALTEAMRKRNQEEEKVAAKKQAADLAGIRSRGETAELRGRHMGMTAQAMGLASEMREALAGETNVDRQAALLSRFGGEARGMLAGFVGGGHAEAVSSRAGSMAGVGGGDTRDMANSLREIRTILAEIGMRRKHLSEVEGITLAP